MQKIYEVKAFYERTSYEKVWLEVVASSEKEAMDLVEQNEADWMDSKEIDSGGGEWLDREGWKIVGTKNLPNSGDYSEEHN